MGNNLGAAVILHEKSNTATGELLADMIDAARKRSRVISHFRINLRVRGMWMFLLNILFSADGSVYADLAGSHEMIV